MALFPLFGQLSRNGSVWDPFSSFPGSVLDHLDSHPFDHTLARSGVSVDWLETPDTHVFKADLPGMKKEEIKVEVLDGKTLSISGKRNRELVQEKDSWRCIERSHGKFRRQFGLPENAKVDDVAAKVENGVLTVTIPKFSPPGTPEVRSIKIS